jgi:hypothetical protein
MRHHLFFLLTLPSIAAAQLSCTDALEVGLGTHSVPSPMFGEPLEINCISNGNLTTHASWYRFTATVDTAIMVSSNVVGNPTVSTRVHVLTGDCNALSCVAGDDYSGPDFTSQTWFRVQASENYYIVWDDLFTQWAFSFSIAAYDPPDGAVNFGVVYHPLGSGVLGTVDMDQNGLDDLVYPGYEAIKIGYQQNDGNFMVSTYPTTTPDNPASWSFAIGDWDGNGHRDMLYGGGNGATFMKASDDGSGYSEISYPQYIFCQRTNFVDINNDGHLDAFSCHDVDANVAFINDGSGDLVFEQGGYGETCGNYGSLFTDVDNDGDQDLFIAKCGCDPVDLLMLNDGSGNFTDVAPQLGLNDGHQSWSAAWGDFDNDGDMDAVIGSSTGDGQKVLRNDGDGDFTDVSAGSGMQNYLGASNEWCTHDFNNDGWLDIHGGQAIHYNRGDMTFSHDTYAPLNGAVGDMNNDGYLDISYLASTYINLGSGANWLRVLPTGVVSNRDGIGARVTIESAMGRQTREIRAGDGFRYMSFIGAHFGLGTDDAIERVTIHWPSGAIDTLLSPTMNMTHTVVEGITTAIRNDRSTSNVQLAPNPATEEVRIIGTEGTTAITVFDVSGRTVGAQVIAGQQFNVTDLPEGVYQVLVEDRLGAHRLQLVIQ